MSFLMRKRSKERFRRKNEHLRGNLGNPQMVEDHAEDTDSAVYAGRI